MFGYLVLEKEMLTTPAGETHARTATVGVGVGVLVGGSATTVTPEHPAATTATQQRSKIRSIGARISADGVDVSFRT
jgi:hypothetical protein